MKRIIVVLVLLLGVGSMAFAAPVPYLGAGQEAIADWIRLKGNTGEWYIAMASRFPSESGLQTMGGVGRGSCSVYRSKRFTEVVCIGTMRIRRLPLEAFSMDPGLNTATLDVRQEGRNHSVTWTGKGANPTGSTEIRFGDEFVEAGAFFYRTADASGKVYGQKLNSRRFDLADMFEGAITGVRFGALHIREIRPNVYRLKRTFSIST